MIRSLRLQALSRQAALAAGFGVLCLSATAVLAQNPLAENDPARGITLRSGLTYSELETAPPPSSDDTAEQGAITNPPLPVLKPMKEETAGTEEAEETPDPVQTAQEVPEDETPTADEGTDAPEITPSEADADKDPLANVSAFLDAGEAEEKKPAPGGPASPGLRVILERKVLRVGTVMRAPYAMRDSTGTLIGHDITLGRAITDTLGVGVSFETLPAEDLVERLRAGEIDIVIGGLAIDPALALQVNFTQPYAIMNIHLVGRAQSSGRALDESRLNTPGLRIGAVEDSPAARAAAIQFPRANLVTYRNDAGAKAAFIKNEVMLLASPSPFPEMLKLLVPGRFVLPLNEPLARTAHGIAIAQGDPEFLAYLNAWIVARKLDRTIERTHAYWFEGTEWVKDLAGRQAGMR